MIKSPSSSTCWLSNSSSSPSSTLSESSSCPLARKPRTPRKRPNHTPNYPKIIFPTKHLSKPCNQTDLLVPFQASIDTSGQRSNFSVDQPKGPSPGEIEKDFDADQSIILDEEIGEGIDCIMGNVENEKSEGFSSNFNFCYGYPVGGLGFEFGQYGMRNEVRAMRNIVDEGDWWRFPSVNVFDLNPKVAKNGGLLLKLNYDAVLDAWSDKPSPFSGECPGSEVAGNDVQAEVGADRFVLG